MDVTTFLSIFGMLIAVIISNYFIILWYRMSDLRQFEQEFRKWRYELQHESSKSRREIQQETNELNRKIQKLEIELNNLHIKYEYNK